MREILRWAAPLALAVLAASPAGAQVVEAGYTPYDADFAAARYRSFANTGGGELYLGTPDLGEAANRVERDLRWQAVNDVVFSYDAAADTLSAAVSNAGGEFSLVNEGWAAGERPAPNLLHITVAARDADSTVRFVGVALNGEPLGDFEADGAWLDWMVEQADLAGGFVVTGQILLDGPFSNSQERSKVEIKAGWREPVAPECAPIIGSVRPGDPRLSAIDEACCAPGGDWEGSRWAYLRCVVQEARALRLRWWQRGLYRQILRAAWRFALGVR